MTSYTCADWLALLSLCRSALDGGTSTVPLGGQFQWAGVLAAAAEHGLVGPVHAVSSTLPDVPEQALTSIRSALLAQLCGNVRLLDALSSILDPFRINGVDVVVLKGPAVALMTSGAISLREFTDLDLLVRPEQLDRARALLIDLGYEQRDSSGPTHLRQEKDIQFFRVSDGLLVELHWAVNVPAVRFSLEETGIWGRVQILEFHGQRISTLSLEDTLLALCIHGSKHGWYSLKWVFDVAQILRRRREELDWTSLTLRCENSGCFRTLLIGVRLACDVFAQEMPGALASHWNDTSVMAIADNFRSAILNNQPIGQRDTIAAQIRGHDRLWDRVAVMVSISVPEIPRLLPNSAGPIKNGLLRFVTRPVRLARRYGIAWVRAAILNR